MKKLCLLILVLSCFIFTSVASAANSWVSTSYTLDGWSYSSKRAPVENGYVDLRLFVDNVEFTDLVFSINYDSNIVSPIGQGSILDVTSGLSVVSVATQNLSGTMKRSTVTLAGTASIGEVLYENEAIFRLRMIPVAEGTLPITLWPSERYPESYYNCSLTIDNNGESVEHQRNQWNDGTTLFTFTDKSSAKVMYHYDYNFGTPVNGYFRVTYSDQSVQEFYASDNSIGITIDPANGMFILSPQPDAVSYALVFPGYGNWEPLDLLNGFSHSVSHSQPLNMFFISGTDFHGTVRANSSDIELSIEQPGIGQDFAASQYVAAIAAENNGIIDTTYTFEYIDDDTVKLIIPDGLVADYYSLYIYKDGLVLGSSWFEAAEFYPVTFNVKDQSEAPVQNASVVIPIFGMEGGGSNLEYATDSIGQAVIELPGNTEWGFGHEYRIMHPDYETVSDYVTVYGEPDSLDITLLPVQGVDLYDFAILSNWWLNQDCMWENNCNGKDFNYDGTVDITDLAMFVGRWLKEYKENVIN